MSNVIPFSLFGNKRNEIRERASFWLARVDSGASSEEIAQLQDWLAEDDRHVEMFMEMAALWDQMAMLSELSDIFPLEKYEPKPKLHSYKRILPLASMSLAACALLAGLYFTLDLRQGTPLEKPRFYQTEVGEQSKISLPDGSELILNTDTVLEVAYTDSSRNVFINKGESLFEIAKDAQRPFRVFVGNQIVEAVGTAFSVQKTDFNEIEILVKEGEVKLHYQQAGSKFITSAEDLNIEPVVLEEKSISLVAGQFAAVLADQSEPVQRQIQPDEIEVELSWQHGMLLFQNDPLEKVLREVARYTTVQIEADEDILDVKVEGYFRAGDIEGLLIAMQQNFQIDVQHIDENHIFLTSQ